MKTNELIDKLSNELVPSTPARSIGELTLITFLSSLALGALSIPVLSMRSSLNDSMVPAMICALAIVLLFGCHALSLLSTPGRTDYRRSGRLAVLIFAVVTIGLTALGIATGDTEGLGLDGARCAIATLAAAIAPMLSLIFFLRGRAPTRLRMAGFFIGLTGTATGGLVMEFVCANDHPLHLLGWHLGLPFLVTGLLTALLTPLILSW